MTIGLSIYSALLMCCIFMMVRNQMVFHYRSIAIDVASRMNYDVLDAVSHLARKDAAAGLPWLHHYQNLTDHFKYLGSYDSQLLNVTVWSYDKMFPKLPRQTKAA